jgi:hypothetical protein
MRTFARGVGATIAVTRRTSSCKDRLDGSKLKLPRRAVIGALPHSQLGDGAGGTGLF